jgi:hypothetical protein
MSQHHMSEENEKLLQEHGISGPEVREFAAKRFLNLSALAVHEKAITLFLLIAIVAAGIFAFLKLGRAEDPTFTIKVFTLPLMSFSRKAPRFLGQYISQST